MATKFNGVQEIQNGDLVVGLTNSRQIKDLGWADMPSMASWYHDNPEKNHLGMINLFSMMDTVRMPTYHSFYENHQVLLVNGANGRFTYDLPVVKSGGMYTVGDTSMDYPYPGLDGGTFVIILDEPLRKGDEITYDVQFGLHVVVSEDHEIMQKGDTWHHVVKLLTLDAGEYFPKDKLKAGIQYFKVGHGLGENSTDFSGISSPGTVGSLTCEYILGNHRGVETFYTQYANQKNISGGSQMSQKFWDKFVAEMEVMGKDKHGNKLDMFYVGKKVRGANGKMGLKKSTVRVGTTLEYLVTLEHMRLESTQLMFGRAGLITDINGVKRFNEGLWHQMRRGRIIKYAKPGGITKGHIKQVIAYLFKNSDIPEDQRRITFDVGKMAKYNMLELFREEFLHQLGNLGGVLGTDRVLPKSPLSGPLNNLKMEHVQIGEINIPEIGWITLNHDPAMDYMPMTDRRDAGMFGDGYAWTSYSMCIKDAASDKYSNAFSSVPSGTKVVEKGTVKSNTYLVKPEGDSVWWGFRNGRYDPHNAAGIVSSMRRMGREFYMHSQSAMWMRDKSTAVIIELQR